MDLPTSAAGWGKIIAFNLIFLNTQTQKADSAQPPANVHQDHTGSKLNCHFFSSGMKDIFVIQLCDECVSAAEAPSVDEEEETSVAPGSCSRMREIIELCKEECNCFWGEWKWAAIQQENEAPVMKRFQQGGRMAPVVDTCNDVGLSRNGKNHQETASRGEDCCSLHWPPPKRWLLQPLWELPAA